MENPSKPKAYSYIRFSTLEQLKGDSERRQLDATIKYVEENNLELDTTLSIKDLGISAFNGKNRTQGALGNFLTLVKDGKIKEGSTLIVESIDRLSRQNVFEALDLFTSIIQAGIILVTLQDKMVYSKESVAGNWTQLIISITIMARAHEESLIKSKRIKEAWSNKRVKAQDGKIKLTGRTPLWLTLSVDKTSFIPIPEVCEAIKIIFQYRVNGMGKAAITKILNQDISIYKPPISPRTKTGGWRESYIQKILTSQAVIGIGQPHQIVIETDKETGQAVKKRKPIGEPIEDYYPPIIPKEQFYEVQTMMQLNRQSKGNAGGRNGKNSNLFSHIAKCGLCKHPMTFVNKGYAKYLVCDSNRRNLGCNAKKIMYDEFERVFFEYFEELNISDYLPDINENVSQYNILMNQIAGSSLDLQTKVKNINNVLDSIELTEDNSVKLELNNRLSQLIADKDVISNNIKKYEAASKKLKVDVDAINTNISTSKDIYSILDSLTDISDKINIRYKLKKEIFTSIERIEIYPLMEKYIEVEEIDESSIFIMKSKYIDKFTIKFRGIEKVRYVFLKTEGELDS